MQPFFCALTGMAMANFVDVELQKREYTGGKWLGPLVLAGPFHKVP